MRVAIAHEWLVNYAGSEKVVEQLLQAFPNSRLLTTVVDKDRIPPAMRHAEPSLLQRIPGATNHHEYLLPMMPISWRLRPKIDEVDAVIVSSHACANSVRAAEGIPVISYCHTPMRYAWQFELERDRFPSLIRPVVRLSTPALQSLDRRRSTNVTSFVANSTEVARRIKTFYGRTATVIHPPVATDFYCFDPNVTREDFFLWAGRLVAYKRPDLVVEAFRNSRHRLIVAGDGPMRPQLEAHASPNITFLGRTSDHQLRDLYRRTQALVCPGEEDFGITMAEAQSCGSPVISINRGGATDIVEHGTSGILCDEMQHHDGIRRAIHLLSTSVFDNPAIAANARKFSQKSFQASIAEHVSKVLENEAPA